MVQGNLSKIIIIEKTIKSLISNKDLIIKIIGRYIKINNILIIIFSLCLSYLNNFNEKIKKLNLKFINIK